MIPEDDRVYHAMSETDSILGYLVHRSRYMPTSEVEIGSDSTVSFRNPHSKLKRGTMSKFPRDDSAVLEELTVQNSELRKQVSDCIIVINIFDSTMPNYCYQLNELFF